MPQSALTAGKVQECESRSRFPLKRYTVQRVHFGKKRGYRCCRSPYSSVIANGDSPLGCLRSLCRNPRRVALDACTPLGLQARPYGPPIGPVFATCLTVCGVRGCRHEMDFRALSRRTSLLWREYTLLVLASAVAAKEARSLIGITVAIRIVAVLICTPLCGYS